MSDAPPPSDPRGEGVPPGHPPPQGAAGPPGYGRSPGYGAPAPFPSPGYAGPPAYGYGTPGSVVVRKTNTNAVVSLVSSIITWVLCPVIPAVVGVVTGFIARRQIRDANGAESGDGLAIAGIILSLLHLGLLLLVVGAIVLITLLGSNASSKFSSVGSAIR